ncbi:hypothetical protein N656DRAFT_735016, partial [Canariomyces notabilis]
MQLPQELRDQIYSIVFFSTRFASGQRNITSITSQRILPAPNGLALLRTCRRVYSEIGRNWLGQVLFHFEKPVWMLDKLANLDRETLSSIRYMRVVGDPVMLCRDEDDVSYRLSATLKLLPGLKLDRLTVLGTRGDKISYQTLDWLIKHSDGWKELYYISHTSMPLAYSTSRGLDFDDYLRRPQPADWQRILEARDGADSGASVKIYRSTDPDRPCSVMHTATGTEFKQSLPPGVDAAMYGRMEDSHLMSPDERRKEVLVVVKRGRGVDYEEKT